MLGSILRVLFVSLLVASAIGCSPAAAPAPTAPPPSPAKEAPKAAPAGPAQEAPKAAPATPATPAKEAPKPAAATPAPKADAAKPAAKAPVEIRIGHGLSGEEQLWLMKAMPQLTPSQGKVYTLNYIPFRGNADRFNAFQAGQLDGGTVTAYTAIFAKGQGIPLKVVAGINGFSTDKSKGFIIPFMALSDSGLNKVTDLKGKTIGIFDYKSAVDMWARLALLKHGLNPDRDVKMAVVSAPTMGNSLRTNKIDVGFFPQPYYHVEMKKGGVKEVFTIKEGAPFYEDNLLVFFGDKFVKDQPDVVKAFLSDYVKATEFYLKNGKEAKQALLKAKLVEVDENIYFEAEDAYRPANGKADVEAMNKLQDLIIQAGWADKKIAINDLVDLSLLP